MALHDFSNQMLLSKCGENVVRLSRHLLTLSEGDRLMTMSALAQSLHSGVGTLQSAMQHLESIGAVQMESRGHQGTYLIRMDRKQLWTYSLYGVVRGSMSLPYTKRLQGLATALHFGFDENQIPLNVTYMRGGLMRTSLLTRGDVDFTVCSRLTADIACQQHPELFILHRFGAGSLTGGIVAMFRSGEDPVLKDGMRVGIDDTSQDHTALTQQWCRDYQVDFVSLSYNNIYQKLDSNVVDCALWSKDDVLEKRPMSNVVPLNDFSLSRLIEKQQEAVVLASSDHFEKLDNIKNAFDLQMFRAIQEDVMEDRRLPQY